MTGLRPVATIRDLLLREHVRRRLEADERREDHAIRASRGETASLLAYFIALLVSHGWLTHLHDKLARVLVALMPLPAVILMVFFGVHRVRSMDELQRRIELVALSVVAIGAWLLAVTCWLLQHGGIGVPSLTTGLLALPVFHGVARRWAQRRYR